MLHRILPCFLMFAAMTGCSDGGPVLVGATGTVTLDGKPLSGATVTMISETGDLSTGFTDADGKFKMTTGGRPGVHVGKAKVGITKFAETKLPEPDLSTGQLKAEDMQKMQMAMGGKTKKMTPESEIPEKYTIPQKSGLIATVDADASKNVFEFPLVGK